MSTEHNHIFPAKRAKSLQSWFRRLLQNPRKILHDHVRKGSVLLDVGCGPGFFTLEAARLVGPSGKVIAADLQEEMLGMVELAAHESGLQERILLHKCEPDRIGVKEAVDLVLAFYVVHELPDQEAFFREMKSILEPGGSVFLVEPGFVVSKQAFQETLDLAKTAGFSNAGRPGVLLSRTAVLKFPD